ncbi:MAG: DMT family transporter [Acidobacteria bacterium]|nr:DMT family transporter [Acidobacteriota bacterium]
MPASRGAGRTVALTGAALTGFAANSILCRLALASGGADPATFTTIRLGSGAIALALIALATGSPRAKAHEGWGSAVALFIYAAAFSWAYVRLTAGTGALVLFASVQATMIGWGLAKGERVKRAEWWGIAAALSGLVVLTFPGLTAPDPGALGLMAAAGAAWGAYSLAGRGGSSPLRTTASNFLKAVPLAAGASLVSLSGAHLSARGALLAAASGALASGVGYALWFAALPALRATRAAIVQLLVPALAASMGVALLGEPITARLVVAAAAIFGGVAVASLSGR